MIWRAVRAGILGASCLIWSSPVVADGVSVGISIGTATPPPPLVVAAPPRVVAVPGSPVYYAPGVEFNLFVLGGQYYSFHNGTWFYAAAHNGPWVVIESAKVPGPVLGVPVSYYRIPPGQAKKMGTPAWPEGHEKGPRGKKWKDH